MSVLEKLNPQRARVISDCVRLIDSEVKSKGLRAAPIKLGYKTIQGVKPGFVGHCVDFLLDDFCGALDPFYARWEADPSRAPLDQALKREENSVAESLLGVTDQRADRSTNRVLKKIYSKLRGTAKKHVQAALPGLGRTLEPYLKPAPAST